MQKIISTNRYQRGLNKNHRIELKPQKESDVRGCHIIVEQSCCNTIQPLIYVTYIIVLQLFNWHTHLYDLSLKSLPLFFPTLYCYTYPNKQISVNFIVSKSCMSINVFKSAYIQSSVLGGRQLAWLIDWNMSNKGLETLMIPDKNSNSKKQNRAGHHFIVKVHHLILFFLFF